MATPKRKTELKLVKAVEEGVKSPRLPPASRPVLLESDVFRKEIGKRLDEVNGEINILDASEDQAEADFRAAIKMLTEKRDAGRSRSARPILSASMTGAPLRSTPARNSRPQPSSGENINQRAEK